MTLMTVLVRTAEYVLITLQNWVWFIPVGVCGCVLSRLVFAAGILPRARSVLQRGPGRAAGGDNDLFLPHHAR